MKRNLQHLATAGALALALSSIATALTPIPVDENTKAIFTMETVNGVLVQVVTISIKVPGPAGSNVYKTQREIVVPGAGGNERTVTETQMTVTETTPGVYNVVTTVTETKTPISESGAVGPEGPTVTVPGGGTQTGVPITAIPLPPVTTPISTDLGETPAVSGQ